MSAKRIRNIILYLTPIIFFLTAACNEQAVAPQDNNYSYFTESKLDSLTLASLTKVDDYPLYAMRYYGDYGFSDYINPEVKDVASLQNIIKINQEPWGCTCFAALGNKTANLLGRNFDWYDHVPLILFTDPPDGYASVSMVDLEYFGFNRNNLPDEAQNNRRLLDTPWLPFDGMNEMGVAIGMMAIDHAQPPYDPSKKTLNELEVIRLVLDYAQNIDHAIELIQQFNVRMETPPIHYLISDSSGHSAIIEFLNGKMIVIKNSEPWQVSTNFIIHGSGAPENVSCWRYNEAYSTLKEAKGKLCSASAMNLLQRVSQSSTIWSMVYKINSCSLSVAVGRKFNGVKEFKLITD